MAVPALYAIAAASSFFGSSANLIRARNAVVALSFLDVASPSG